jgi:hypothetical protein
MLNKHNLGEELGAPMIVLMAAALVGGVGSFVVLWPYGALGAQFGATSLALMAGLLLASRRAKVEQNQSAAFSLASSA